MADDVEEVLTIQQRMKKSRQLKRLAPRLARFRKIRKKRLADTSRLKTRSRIAARKLLRKKVAGKRGEKFKDLSPSGKIAIDRLVAKRGKSAITKLAKRLLPKVRKKEIQRVAQARKSNEELVNENLSKQNANKSASGYDLYHKTYSAAVQHAMKQAEARGFKVDEDDWFNQVSSGPRKPSSGKTNSFKIDLVAVRGGAPSKKKLHLQVANLDNKRYELNMYVEDVNYFDEAKKKKPAKKKKTYEEFMREAKTDGPAVKSAKSQVKREKQNDNQKHDKMLDRARLADTRRKNRKTTPAKGVRVTVNAKESLEIKAAEANLSYEFVKEQYDIGYTEANVLDRRTREQQAFARVNTFIANYKNGNHNV